MVEQGLIYRSRTSGSLVRRFSFAITPLSAAVLKKGPNAGALVVAASSEGEGRALRTGAGTM